MESRALSHCNRSAGALPYYRSDSLELFGAALVEYTGTVTFKSLYTVRGSFSATSDTMWHS